MNNHSAQKGMTLVELMVAMVVLLIAMTSTLQFLSSQIGFTSSEIAKTRTSLSEMPAEMVLTRDMAMAGLGVPKRFSGSFVPFALNNNAGPNNSDSLQMVGAAMSSSSDDFYKWGYNDDNSLRFTNQVSLQSPSEFQENSTFSHAFEPNDVGDRVVFLDVHSMELLDPQVYQITSVNSGSITLGSNVNFEVDEGGAIAYNMGGMNATTFNDYVNGTTGYDLGGSPPDICAPGTNSLLREYGMSEPVMDCVLDFQVQVGVPGTGGITWQSSLPSNPVSNAKMVRIQIVHQFGKHDQNYQYPNSSITTADNTVNLSTNQREYKWRTKTLTIPLREIGL